MARAGTGPLASVAALATVVALLVTFNGWAGPTSGAPSSRSAPEAAPATSAAGSAAPARGIGPALAPAAVAPGGVPGAIRTPDGPAPSTVAVDLLNGATNVSSQLVYNGYFNSVDTSFPTLLTGSAISRFWSLNQPVMLMAPALTLGHDTGLLLFPVSTGQGVSVNAIGSFSPTLSGDGLEAYLMLSPTSTADWNTAFFATDPEGPNGTFPGCAGSMIFPYSSSAYLALQWEPAYTVARCASSTGQFNLYLVTPGTGGVVTRSDITYVEAVGAWSGGEPAPDSFLDLSATYFRGNDSLVADVVDENDTAVNYSLSVSLEVYGFEPGYPASGTYYVGAGGSGNHPAGWGLVYLAAGNSSSVPTPPPTPPTITSVAFSGSPGNYTLTVDGSNFGPAPVAMPTYGTTGYFRLGDDAELGHGEWGYGGDANALEYDSWTTSQVVVSRFGGEPLDALQLALWNPSNGEGAAWGGNVPTANLTTYPAWYPEIDRVQFSGAGAAVAITVQGSGFGPAPVSLPFTGDLEQFGLTDWRDHCGGGSSAFGAGFTPWGVGAPEPVTLTYTAWTVDEIQVSGFAGTYGSGCALALPGDPVTLSLWSSNASADTGPQTAWGGPLAAQPSPLLSNRSAEISPSLDWTGSVAPAGDSLLVPGGDGLLQLTGPEQANVTVLDGGANGYWSYATPNGTTDLLGGSDYNCPGGVRLASFDPTNGSLRSLSGLLPASWTATGHCRSLRGFASGGGYTLLLEETNGSFFPQVGLLNGTSFSNVTGKFPYLPGGQYYAAYGDGAFLLATDGQSYLFSPSVSGGEVLNLSVGPAYLSGTFADPPFLGPAPSLVAYAGGARFVLGYANDVETYSVSSGFVSSVFTPPVGSVSTVGFGPGSGGSGNLWVGVWQTNDQTTLSSFSGLSNASEVATVSGRVTDLTPLGPDLWASGTDFEQPQNPACGCEPVLDEVGSAVPTFPVTFVETGLPAGVSWSVNVSTQELTDVAGTALNETFADLPNGTYTFTVNDSSTAWQVVNQSGSFRITGGPVLVPVNFVPARVVPITESGLAPGTGWTVEVNGTTVVNEADAIHATPGEAADGPELFSRTTVPVHYELFSRTTKPVMTLPTGNFTVNYSSPHGTPLSRALALEVNATGNVPAVQAPFTHVAYPIGFEEAGLATGVPWSVNSTSWNATATASSVTVYLKNGSYPVSVVEPSGYHAEGPGTIVVQGAGQNASVRFVPTGPANREVRFVESGLPAATNWTVTLSGSALSSQTRSIQFLEPVGAHAFSVRPIPGYTAPAGRTIDVHAHGVTVKLKFAPVRYPIAFAQTGLPKHASWRVKIGSTSYRIPASGRTLELANGTYDLYVSGPSGYTTAGQRQVVVDGSGTNVSVTFSTMHRAGLPATPASAAGEGSRGRPLGATASMAWGAAGLLPGWVLGLPGVSVAVASASRLKIRRRK